MAAVENTRKTGFNTLAVVSVGLAAVIFVFALSLFIQGGYNALRNREEQAKIFQAGLSDDTIAQLAEQQSLLNEKPRYLDSENGVLCIPIEDAMERVVERNAN